MTPERASRRNPELPGMESGSAGKHALGGQVQHRGELTPRIAGALSTSRFGVADEVRSSS